MTAVLRSSVDGRVILHVSTVSLGPWLSLAASTHLFVFWLTSVTQARCDRVNDGTAKIVAAVGESFENALAACVYHARDIMQAHETQHGSKLDHTNAQTLAGDVRSDWMEDWHDGLGFCKIGRHRCFFL